MPIEFNVGICNIIGDEDIPRFGPNVGHAGKIARVAQTAARMKTQLSAVPNRARQCSISLLINVVRLLSAPTVASRAHWRVCACRSAYPSNKANLVSGPSALGAPWVFYKFPCSGRQDSLSFGDVESKCQSYREIRQVPRG